MNNIETQDGPRYSPEKDFEFDNESLTFTMSDNEVNGLILYQNTHSVDRVYVIYDVREGFRVYNRTLDLYCKVKFEWS